MLRTDAKITSQNVFGNADRGASDQCSIPNAQLSSDGTADSPSVRMSIEHWELSIDQILPLPAFCEVIFAQALSITTFSPLQRRTNA
jgi:hypothetical protein